MGGGLSLLRRNASTADSSNPSVVGSDSQQTLPFPNEDHITIVNHDGQVSLAGTEMMDNAQFLSETPSGNMSPIAQNSARAEVNVGLAIVALTPRDGSATLDSPQCVPYTPHGDEASVFKYYCPLCMQYFKDIMKMKCCGNYICGQCCKEYISTKGINMAATASITAIEERFINTNAVPCPHCQVSGFHPMSVSFEEIVRDYSSRYVPGYEQSSTSGYSPLRVGESFEDLKRKMIPYKNAPQLPGLSGNDESTPRESEEQAVLYDVNSSPQREAERDLVGIAMVHYVSSTPLMGSPRMRLEPTSPDDIPHSAPRSALDGADSKGIDDHVYFQSDLSGVFESHRPHAEEKSQDRQLLVPLFESESLISPHELRVSSPSPRIAESKRDVYVHSEEKPPICGTSRNNSRNGSRNGSRNNSFMGTSAGASTHSISSRNVHMNIFASGVVDQMFRAALAQHVYTVQQ